MFNMKLASYVGLASFVGFAVAQIDCTTVRCMSPETLPCYPDTVKADPANLICCDYCPELTGCEAVRCASPESLDCYPFYDEADPENGKCCPSCPEVDCSAVLCLAPESLPCALEDVIPADIDNGQCCPTCPPKSTGCETVRCASPESLECFPVYDEADPENGKCCPSCPEVDCSAVRCMSPESLPCALEDVIPADVENGKCCPSCPEVDCSAVRCMSPESLPCALEDVIPADIENGKCCPTCPVVDCRTVRCINVDVFACDKVIPADPENGICCDSCADYECSSSSPCKEGYECVPSECDENTFCPFGTACESGKCVDIKPAYEECNTTPGEARCPDNFECVTLPYCEGDECPGVCKQLNRDTCGGFLGSICPSGFDCLDIPEDECDPLDGGADCLGYCVRPVCGGFAGFKCPEGLVCTRDPLDSCTANGGADCLGLCVPYEEQGYCFLEEEKSVCDLPMEVGPCEAMIDRWFYDSEMQTCKRFTYGGCGGNANNFRTQEECLDSIFANSCSFDSACGEVAQSGLCKAYMPRFYFDYKSQTCKSFIYGGCGGNNNNFLTVQDCMDFITYFTSERACHGEDAAVCGADNINYQNKCAWETSACLQGYNPDKYEEGICVNSRYRFILSYSAVIALCGGSGLASVIFFMVRRKRTGEYLKAAQEIGMEN